MNSQTALRQTVLITALLLTFMGSSLFMEKTEARRTSPWRQNCIKNGCPGYLVIKKQRGWRGRYRDSYIIVRNTKRNRRRFRRHIQKRKTQQKQRQETQKIVLPIRKMQDPVLSPPKQEFAKGSEVQDYNGNNLINQRELKGVTEVEKPFDMKPVFDQRKNRPKYEPPKFVNNNLGGNSETGSGKKMPVVENNDFEKKHEQIKKELTCSFSRKRTPSAKARKRIEWVSKYLAKFWYSRMAKPPSASYRAHMYAQFSAESSKFETSFKEIGRGRGKRYGKYYGRGPIQLTWKNNYAAFNCFAKKLKNNPGIKIEKLAGRVCKDKRGVIYNQMDKAFDENTSLGRENSTLAAVWFFAYKVAKRKSFRNAMEHPTRRAADVVTKAVNGPAAKAKTISHRRAALYTSRNCVK